MSRTEAREQAFVFLFEKLFNPELSFDELCALAAQSRVFEPDLYTRDIFEKTVENIETTDSVINSYAKKWRTARMPKVTLCILRLAVTEILLTEATPDSVAANEAVELAKKYATPDDAQFINGILGAVIRGKAQ